MSTEEGHAALQQTGFAWDSHLTAAEKAFRKGDLVVGETILKVLMDVAKAVPADMVVQVRLLSGLGQVANGKNRSEEACGYFRKAIELADSKAIDHQAVALALDGLSEAYKQQGKLHEAEAEVRKAVRMMDSLVGAEHPEAYYLRERMEKLRNEREIADLGASEVTLLDKLRASANVSSGNGAAVEGVFDFMFDKYISNGHKELEHKNYSEAERMFLTAVEKSQTFPRGDGRRFESLRLLAGVHEAIGHDNKAAETYGQALTMAFEEAGDSTCELGKILMNLGHWHVKHDEQGLGKKYYQQACEIFDARQATADSQVAHACLEELIQRFSEDKKWKGWSS